MKLEKLKIKNYRNYNGEYEISFNHDLTAFIGKNDAGKSTIFDALDVFFNDAKPDLSDLNIYNADEKEIAITCVFSEFPNEVIIDSSASTKIKDEYLLNKDGLYEVVKKFKCLKTISSPEIYIKAFYPTQQNFNDLHTLTIEKLKERAKEISVEDPEDKRQSNLWRRQIWNSSNDLKLEEKELKVDDFENKAKDIYKKLETYYPLFFLFKSDRQTSDSDAEAKDPIQLAVKEAQKEYDEQIDELRQKIQERVEEVSMRALEKLHEMDASLAEKLKPVLKSTPKWTFDYRIEDERGVALNKRGSGTRRLVLLNFFRAEAERKSKNDEGDIIYAIEEPETSQHPNNQKLIINSLAELSKDSKRQVLISTHSPELLKKVSEEAICFINSLEEEKIILKGKQALYLAAESLGIFSEQKFNSTNIFVLVESMADCLFLEHACRCLKDANHLDKNFEELKILTLPLGGKDCIRIWVENNKAENLGLKYVVFMDSDRENSNKNVMTKNEEMCDGWKKKGILAFCTKKREIENYIDKNLVDCEYGDYDDAKNIISRAKNISSRKVIEKYWKEMTADQIISSSTETNNGKEEIEIKNILMEILNLK